MTFFSRLQEEDYSVIYMNKTYLLNILSSFPPSVIHLQIPVMAEVTITQF